MADSEDSTMRLFGSIVLLFMIPFAPLAFAAPPPAHGSAMIRVLLFDGQSGGPYHNWKLTTPVLKAELEETGLFQVTVITAPTSDGDFTNFTPDLSHYQVIVLNYDAPTWPEDLRTRFEQFVGNGGGLVVIHAADNAFPDWPAYNLMIGIGGWRKRTEAAGPMWYFKDGKLVSDSSPGTTGSHGARLPFQVVTRQPEHPIMRGLPSVWMHVADELYATLRGPGKNMTVLATAHSDAKNKGTDQDEPMALVVNYGRGRVFHTTMGHDVSALSCVGLMTLFQRGTEWAATGRVTQKVPAGFPTANTVSFRADIASMDPAYLNGASPLVREMPMPAQTHPVSVHPVAAH
jgi:type 1 glutamine amidotransferase